MGQEISQSHFDAVDFDRFHRKLTSETQLLSEWFQSQALTPTKLIAGLEIEAWLIDKNMRPAPINEHYLATIDEPLASAELAKFNIELNTHPLAIEDTMLSQLHQQLQDTWHNAASHAEALRSSLIMIGILPTLLPTDLTIKNMSDLNRYRALNEQILATQDYGIHLNITGEEHLDLYHDDIMMESATTSLQLHTKVPPADAHHYYNAAIIASAPMVAVCANSPYLFNKNLWHESRIALFEQAVDIGGYNGASQGPVKRVSFGTGYARHSLIECFEENLAHFPILLPENLDTHSDSFAHLKLHNGTIWRWNRPLIGTSEDGQPHVRIEHRTPASGPTLIDTVANAAFYFGLTKNLTDLSIHDSLPLPFSHARDNFYRAARYGLNAHISWFNDKRQRLHQLILADCLPRAQAGLDALGIAVDESEYYLNIIKQRVDSGQTGSQWQRQFMQKYPNDFVALTEQYLCHQQQNRPVSEWTLS